MSLKCHKYCKVLNVHLWGKYVNIYATYEVLPLLLSENCCTQKTMMMMQDDDDTTACLHTELATWPNQSKSVLSRLSHPLKV